MDNNERIFLLGIILHRVKDETFYTSQLLVNSTFFNVGFFIRLGPFPGRSGQYAGSIKNGLMKPDKSCAINKDNLLVPYRKITALF